MSKPGGAVKEWFSCQELADHGLAALAGTERGAQKQAEREGWQSRPREGRGGGREYHLSSLPEAARIDLALRSLQTSGLPMGSSSIPAKACPAVSIPQDAGLAGHAPFHGERDAAPGSPDETVRAPHAPDAALPSSGAPDLRARVTGGRAARRAAARIVVVNLVKSFKAEGALSMVAARQAFSALFNASEIPVEGWVKEEVGQLSVTSLQRWQSQLAKEGSRRLAGKYGNRKGQGQIEGDARLRDFCIANMTARPHLTASQLAEAIHARMGKEIPKRTVQRFMAAARETHADAFLQAQNPDKYKNLRLVAFGSQSEGATALNAIWEIDASPADIMTIDGRLTLVGLIDVFSRRAKILVTPTPKAVAATLLIRKCILDWGVPDLIKLDNGKDFASAHVARALAGLDIEQKFCPPFTPEGKPHIERFFQTLQHGFVSLLPGFIGHDVSERKAIEARRGFAQRFGDGDKSIQVELTGEELQAKLDDWIEHVYHRRRHETLKTSPMLQAVKWMGATRMIESERALDMLLAEAPDTDGIRVVGKKGIRVENAEFIANDLGAWVGERVHVRLDPGDMGRIIVYSLEGAFICVAECPERTGIDRREVAMRAKQIQKEKVKVNRAEGRRIARDHRVHNIADEIVARHRAEQIVAFPQHSETFSTPALDAADDAARALHDPLPPVPLREEDAALADEAREAMVLQMPERDEAAAKEAALFTDTWVWFRFARDNYATLNDIQRETYHALESDPLILIRLEAETSARA